MSRCYKIESVNIQLTLVRIWNCERGNIFAIRLIISNNRRDIFIHSLLFLLLLTAANFTLA